MDTILEAVPLSDYRIRIRTSSGIAGVFDVKPYLKGSAFRELEDEAYFRKVYPAHHGIRWPNEQDFSADTITWDIQQGQQEHARRACESSSAAPPSSLPPPTGLVPGGCSCEQARGSQPAAPIA